MIRDSDFDPRAHQAVDLWAMACEELESARNTPSHPWSHVCFNTHGLEGPHARILVLRDVDPLPMCLTFFTDARSRKVQELDFDRRSGCLIYDVSRRIQLQLQGATTIMTDQIEVARYCSLLTPAQRKLYFSPQPPGSPWNAYLDSMPTEEAAQRAVVPENFRVIRFTAQSAELLFVLPEDNVRFRFERDDNGWNGLRIVP